MGMYHEALVRVPGGLGFDIVATPTLSDKEALVAPEYVGVCGTDLDIIRGARPDSARILGHEGTATVVAAGINSRLAVGEQLVFNPVNPTDQDDILGHSRDGLLQRNLVVTNGMVEKEEVIRLPCPIKSPLGALIEPLATVLYGQRLLLETIQPLRMAVIGLGPIGLMHALSARIGLGVEITAVCNSRSRLEWAVQNGIIEPKNGVLAGSDPQSTAFRTGRQFDAIIVATPRTASSWAVECAISAVKAGGCLDVVSSLPETITTFGDRLVGEFNRLRRLNVCGRPRPGHRLYVRRPGGEDIVVIGHRGSSGEDILKSVELLQSNPNLWEKLLTHTVDFREGPGFIAERLSDRIHRGAGDEIVKMAINLAE